MLTSQLKRLRDQKFKQPESKQPESKQPESKQPESKQQEPQQQKPKCPTIGYFSPKQAERANQSSPQWLRRSTKNLALPRSAPQPAPKRKTDISENSENGEGLLFKMDPPEPHEMKSTPKAVYKPS